MWQRKSDKVVDLKKIAILLIYQDGLIEHLEIDKNEYHIEYFKNLREKSLRFRKLTSGLDFKEIDHDDMFTFLVKSGIIEIYNGNLAEMAVYPERFSVDFEPYFVVALPEDYASISQKKSFYEVISDYDKDKLWFGRFRNESDNFLEGENAKSYVLDDELMNVNGEIKR